MALRTRYGYNAQTVNWADMTWFTPVCYVDVVPGETVQGTVAVNLFSQPVKAQIQTRTYADVYAFYVPYRIMDSSWPDFISKNDGSAAVPTAPDRDWETST